MARPAADSAGPDVGGAARHQHDGLRAPPAAARRRVPRRLLRARGAGEGPARAGRRLRALPPAPAGDAPVRCEAAGYLAPRHAAVSRQRAGGRSTAAGSARSSRYRGDARPRREDRRSCGGSTCCRCRRPTTSRRACSCSKRWRAACRSCSRAAARSPRWWSGPAAACWSSRTIPRASPTGCSSCGRDRPRLRGAGPARVRRGARALLDRAVGRPPARGLSRAWRAGRRMSRARGRRTSPSSTRRPRAR